MTNLIEMMAGIMLGLAVGLGLGLWAIDRWANRAIGAHDSYAAVQAQRVRNLEGMIDQLTAQRLQVAPPAQVESLERAVLPPSVEAAIDGFEDDEVREEIRARAIRYFATNPSADPSAYVANLLASS
jgi:hypothetical protein